ncbi:MAG: hypothetical protein QOF30_432 [Acidimicrobiaceae bacterium]|jgi:phosphatidylserine/phosphatidylglycerophosphate/cardiolipin synthase-like enzyme|nr:hypothetical protein [Acidimicrobiaceae bacterium]
MTGNYQVNGSNDAASFTLTIHRGEGMVLLAMNWRQGRPPSDFVGFGIQFFPPGVTSALDVPNRLSFDGSPDFGKRQRSMDAPIQKFRWVHFPHDADQSGAFRYVVTPVFMDADDKLRYGEAQEAAIELASETYPGVLNVSFTRGFIASQAFVDTFQKDGDIATLLPANADDGLDFVPTHPDAKAALAWMGFEARRVILEVLDQAVAEPSATVRVVAYDLSEPDVVSRLELLGDRLRVIIDDSGSHQPAGSAESRAAGRLITSAGAANVKRQHMANLQHNKTIVVTGANLQKVVCGSTNYSWRGFFVQNNNAVVLTGEEAVKPFGNAFEQYWVNGPTAFGKSASAVWTDLPLPGIQAKVTFSPHSGANAALASVADDIRTATTSSLLYSLAFLYQTKGVVRDAVTAATENASIFVVGISDRAVGGIAVQTPNGNVAPVHPAALSAAVPIPFSAEPTGGGGIRMHHKFVVIDFDKPTARVYLGSYNFSGPADNANGENLLLIADRRVATAYAVEAVRLFDHYQFRLKQDDPSTAKARLALQKPPRAPGELPWFEGDYTDANKVLDRKIFS